MKKKLLCFLVAVICVLPLSFAGCSDDEDVETNTGTKPLTLNLYGITNESTTEEAIQQVQAEMNQYTEGKFNTHIVLHLYPEDEYYDMLDAKLADIERIKKEEEEEAKRKKQQQAANQAAGITAAATETTAPETDAETYEDSGVVKPVYPEETQTQLDIFMVQGTTHLNRYKEAGYLSSLSESLANSSKILNRYISAGLWATVSLDGTANLDGTVTKGTVYGVPNNYVAGDYTYLLVNKELAQKYYYSAADVSTLPTLANFLDDVATNHPDYIPLYNEPVFSAAYLTEEPSLIGGVIYNTTTGFSRLTPRNLLGTSAFQTYWQQLYNFRKAGYITVGDYYAMPVDEKGNPEKVGAAFLKGNASIPEQYEEDYFVIPYANPFASASERPGTIFCVSTFTANVDRCMEIITALQTVSSFRNTFQYGVENVHHVVDEYTGMISYLNDSYSMNPEDTGNLFILSPNDTMSEQMLKLAENNWALGKQQLRDTITSPYAMFNFRIITEDNYKTDSYVYAEEYKAALEAAKEEQGSDFKEEEFEYDAPYSPGVFTDTILNELSKLSQEYLARIEDFEEYVGEDGEVVTIRDYIRSLRTEFEQNEYYKMLVDSKNADSPSAQYDSWYTTYGPQMSA